MKNHHVETECIPRERFSPVADYCLSAIDGTRLRIQPVDATH